MIELVVVPEMEDADLQQEETLLGREIEEVVAAADESTDASPRTPAAPTAPPPGAGASDGGMLGEAPADIERLFASLKIRTTAEGGITIEAPPEAAGTLASVFEGMARLLRMQSRA